MRRFAPIIAVTPALFALVQVPQESVTLRLKLPVDQTMRFVSKSDLKQQMMGLDISSVTTLTMNVAVTATPGGFQTVIKSSDVSVLVPEGSPLAGQVDAIKAAAAGSTITAVYSDRGKQVSYRVDSTDAAAKQISAGMGAAGLGFLGIEYPEQALKPGDTWTQEYDFGKLGGPTAPKSMVPVTFTLKSVSGGVAIVNATLKGQFQVETPAGASTVQMKSDSTYTVDVASGVPSEITTISANQIELGGGQIEQKTTQTLKRL